MKRVITTTDEAGRSRVLIEEHVPANKTIWETLPELPLGRDPEVEDHGLNFPAGGTQVRYFELPPDAVLEEYLKAGIPGHDARGFHKTGTLDFVVLLKGRLTLILDDGRVELEPGDIVVQRDTNHAWRAGDAPAQCLSIISSLQSQK